VANPVAGCEFVEQRTVQAARGAEVGVLDHRVLAQPGQAQSSAKPLIVACGGQRQAVAAFALAIGRRDRDLVVTNLAGGSPVCANGHADVVGFGIGRGTHRYDKSGPVAIGLPPLLPERGHAFDRLAVAARHCLKRAVGCLALHRLGGLAVAEHQRRFSFLSVLLAHRAAQLRHGIGTEALAQKPDDWPGFHGLHLLRIAQHHELESGALLQGEDVIELAGAEQSNFVQHDHGFRVEREPSPLNRCEE